MTPPPADTPIWKQQAERGSPWLVRLICWIALHLGRTPARVLLHPITLYFLLFAPRARRASRDYLRRLFGRPPRAIEVYRHLHCFAAVLLDRVFLLAGREACLDIHVHGLDALERHIGPGRGVLLLSAHVGSFDALRTLVRRRPELGLKIVMEPGQNPTITAILHQLAPDLAPNILPAGGLNTMILIDQAIRDGQIVGMMGDRCFSDERTVPVMLLGAPVELPRAPFMLPLVSGAPLVVAFGLYRGGRRYDLHFESIPVRANPPRAEREQEVAALATRYAQRVEAQLARAPYNWFNFFEYWGPRKP